MKKIFFITATNTNVGKTYFCETFSKYLSNKNYKVGYFKPIETGVTDKAVDGNKMLHLIKSLNTEFKFSIDEIVPYQFNLPAAPFVAKQNIKIDIEKLNYLKNQIIKKCDVLLIEGAGGLMVPIELDFFMIDLIKALNIDKTILIAHSKLGCINDTLLSINILKQYKIRFDFLINLYKDKENFHKITYPFFKKYFDRIKTIQNNKDLDEILNN